MRPEDKCRNFSEIFKAKIIQFLFLLSLFRQVQSLQFIIENLFFQFVSYFLFLLLSIVHCFAFYFYSFYLFLLFVSSITAYFY